MVGNKWSGEGLFYVRVLAIVRKKFLSFLMKRSCLCRRSLLAGVVQIEAVQELCKLLVVVSSEAQKDFLGMLLLVVTTNISSTILNIPFQW
jgi:hypothetical protein